MHYTSSVLPTFLVVASGAKAALTTGFSNARTYDSQGGLATCVSGDVPVTVTSPKNVQLNVPIPQNQLQVTQSFLSTFSTGIGSMGAIGPQKAVTGNFSIYSTLCVPKSSSNSTAGSKAIQFLTHGIGFDHTYWDFTPSLSYVDAAAMAGAPTFSYDRLGVGRSSTPDPLQVVQGAMEIVIAHALIGKLRAGAFADTTYSKVVAVGHSFGSAISTGVASQYPTDVNGVVLTGFSANMTALGFFTAALNLQIASQNSPLRFSKLNNGYLASQNVISNQFDFFHYPGFEPDVLYKAELTKGTVTIGELMTMSLIGQPAMKYTGPVAVFNGEFDVPFCYGNCRVPSDQGAIALKALYPSAGKKRSVIIPNTGHGVNFHLAAPQAYQQIQQFVTNNAL